jgi:fructokinase
LVQGKLNVTSVGEVLWDIIGNEKYLGGAPFNFAAHSQQLGARSTIVSRVGTDQLGDEILSRAAVLDLDSCLIQRDSEHPSGQVQVSLGPDGQPSYDIRAGAAYDYLQATPEAIARVATSDVVCFGTLAQRFRLAKESIHTLLSSATNALIVCDLNLRPPHYTTQTVRESIARCNILKLNEDELRSVQEMLGPPDLDQDEFSRHLLTEYKLELLCVTRGAQGCLLRTVEEQVDAPGYRCQVMDTIGSGDAFTAALIAKYTAGSSLAATADFANLVGAYVATQSGAVPRISADKLERFAKHAHHNNRQSSATIQNAFTPDR